MHDTETMSLEEFAQTWGRAPATVKRHIRHWHRKWGVPLPIAGSEWRWSRAVVSAFLRAQQQCFPLATSATNDNVPGLPVTDASSLIAAQKKALHQLYGGTQ
ncbi:MAG: hypothetical protein AAF468_21870 [Pseudomonadota bacterium]